VADMPLQITTKTAVRGRPFEKGRSGNPAGRPRGSTNRATKSAAFMLDGEAEALTRKAVELALGGDASALRLCLERILAPRRGRPVQLALPPIRNAADIAGTMGAITAAAACGDITPGEAAELAKVVDTLVRSIETSDFDRRLQMLEARHASGP
jgi:hypothetical protein